MGAVVHKTVQDYATTGSFGGKYFYIEDSGRFYGKFCASTTYEEPKNGGGIQTPPIATPTFSLRPPPAK